VVSIFKLKKPKTMST